MNASLRAGSAGCRQAWQPGPYREALALRDGRNVLLRPARHSDAAALQAFFKDLSPQSRLQRFHGAVNQLPADVVRAFTTQVPGRHVALVATARTDDGLQRLLAEARYVTDPGRSGWAEFALAIADDWQGLGLGRALMQRLATHAESKGLVALEGSVMPGNQPMLALMRGLGARLRPTTSGVHALFLL